MSLADVLVAYYFIYKKKNNNKMTRPPGEQSLSSLPDSEQLTVSASRASQDNWTVWVGTGGANPPPRGDVFLTACGILGTSPLIPLAHGGTEEEGEGEEKEGDLFKPGSVDEFKVLSLFT